MNLYKNYYKILKLEKSATDEQIKKAYIKLAKKYHPDHNQNSTDSVKMFQELKEAYDVLTSFKKEYDNSSPHVKKIGNKLDIELTINAEKNMIIKYQAYRGCKKCDQTGFDVKSDFRKCKTCNGKGFDDIDGEECLKCFGTGKTYDTHCQNCKGLKLVQTTLYYELKNLTRDTVKLTIPLQGHRNLKNKTGDLILTLVWP